MSSALDARQTAVDWGVAKAVTDTNPFAHSGYKLASRLLWTDQRLIESLARELTSQGTIEGDALRKWLDANASPLNLMNWKQTRRTENIVDRSTVMPTKTSVPSNSLSKRFPQDPWGVSVTQDRLSRLSQHITERTEAMHNMKKLILSVFIFTFGLPRQRMPSK